MIILILCIVLLPSFSFVATALDIAESDAIGGYYLYSFDNEMILSHSNTKANIPASSTVKLMTALLVLESGISGDTVVYITTEMINEVAGRFMGLKVGDRLTVSDLLYAMVNASFNDAAQALALTVSPSINEFILKMNERATELGMSSTRYFDFTGMSSLSYTTIADIVKLSNTLIQNDEFLSITSTKVYNMSEVASCDYTKITNRSTLLSKYKGFHNFNVGSTNDNGDSAVSYFHNGKSSFLCIVMNAKSNDSKRTDNIAEAYTQKLINHGLYDYSYKVLLKANEKIDSLPVKLSVSNNEVSIYTGEELKVYVSDDTDINDIVYHYYFYDDELEAPIKSGDEVGKVIASKNGKFLASAPLIVMKDIKRNGFLFIMDSFKNYLLSASFLIALVSFAILIIYYRNYKRNMLKKMFSSYSLSAKRRNNKKY